jgi:branched-chain amino acid transport system substrate-binding protein
LGFKEEVGLLFKTLLAKKGGRNMKGKLGYFVIVLCFVVVICGSLIRGIAGAEEPGVTKDKIIIGTISPLTGSLAMVGIPIADAVKDYFSLINEQGGIHGRKIEVLREDDKYEPPQAIASLKKLIDRDKIFACASTSGTPITAAVTPTVEKEKLPSMAGNPAYGIFFPKPPKYLFAWGPVYADQVIFNIEYILFTLKAKDPKLAFFYQDDDFGQDGYKGFKAAVEKYKLKVVATEKYSRGAIDISSQVLNIKKANPDFLIITAIPSHAIMLLKEAKNQGLTIPIFSCGNSALGEVIKVAGDAANIYHCAEWTALPNETNVPGMAKLIQNRDKRNPADKVPSKYYLLSYVNAMILGEGIKRAGKDLTREKLRDALESMKDFNTDGLTGPISFSPDNHCPATAMRVIKANSKTGYYEPITDWGSPKLNFK